MTYQSPYQAYPYPWGGVAPVPQYVPPTPSTYQTMSQSQQPPQQQSTGAAALTGRTVRSAQEVTPQEVPMDGTLALFTGTVTDYVTVAADPVSVARTIPVRTDSCCCGRLAVVNTGTSDVIVSPGASLYVRRVA